VKLRALATACALAVGLCGLPARADTTEATGLSREDALRKFQWEQALEYLRARGDKVVPNSPYDPMPLSKPLDAKTQFERMGGKLVPSAPTHDQLLQQAIAKTFRQMLGGFGCCPCVTAGSCSDSLFCTGVEICDATSNCAHGPTACNDGNPCTQDLCTENTDTCSFPTITPAAVAQLNLARSAPLSPVATLAWSGVSGANSYNIYRGTAKNLSNLTCFIRSIPATSQNDDGAIPAGAFYYLVTSMACAESDLGSGNPNPRPPAPGCP
jgi:hypothetical protein